MSQLSLKQKLLFGGFILVLIAIPLGTLLVSQTQILGSKAQETEIEDLKPVTNIREVPKDSPADLLKKVTQATSSSTPVSGTGGVTLGMVMNLAVIFEGRPQGKQAGKVFVGIAEGQASSKPTYLLSFTVDFPDSGVYKGLSVTGLTSGTAYTAYLKGQGQIATSSAFTANSNDINLNNNQPITLLSGDLNEDNVINTSDNSLLLGRYGAKAGETNYLDLADFNLDGIINNFDLSYIIKNFGKTGQAGVWVSTPPVASGSAELSSPQGATSSGGYWIFVPPIP